MEKTISITIYGKVQGVFYRQSAKEMADALHINGEVSNHPDGTVRLIATADETLIARLIAWCRVGPPRARVTDIQIEEQPLQRFDKFHIKR
jgi:acylphosphatase